MPFLVCYLVLLGWYAGTAWYNWLQCQRALDALDSLAPLDVPDGYTPVGSIEYRWRVSRTRRWLPWTREAAVYIVWYTAHAVSRPPPWPGLMLAFSAATYPPVELSFGAYLLLCGLLWGVYMLTAAEGLLHSEQAERMRHMCSGTYWIGPGGAGWTAGTSKVLGPLIWGDRE